MNMPFNEWAEKENRRFLVRVAVFVLLAMLAFVTIAAVMRFVVASDEWTFTCGPIPENGERGTTLSLYCADPNGNIWQVEAVLNSIKETQ